MDLSIIGSGYVGLVSGACFAEVGHHVVCVDNNQQKVESLQAGHVPIYEPGLEEVIQRNVAAGRLRFTNSTEDGVDHSEVVFIAVPTPPQADGSVDLSYIERVARDIAAVLKPGQYRVVVDKSTVPVKTGDKVAETIKRYGQKGAEFDVVSNPEFLREGCAVRRSHAPGPHCRRLQERPGTGAHAKALPALHGADPRDRHQLGRTHQARREQFPGPQDFSYINAVSAICEASGADVEKVADGIGMDKRIGRNFLNAGLGYGGSCFPKDIAAFIAISEQLGVPFTLLKEVQRINQSQRERFLKSMRDTLWILRDKKIAVWGLTFKGDTDDIRSSVSIDLIADLIKEGAHVTAYDPKGMDNVRNFKLIPEAKLVDSRPGSGARGRGAHHRHGMARICPGGPRPTQGGHGLADGVRWPQSAQPRDDGAPGIQLPQHRTARRGEKLKILRGA